MPWHQLELSLNAAELPKAEPLLELVGAEAISLGDAARSDILEPDPGTTPVWPNVSLRALFPTETIAELAGRTLASGLDRDIRTHVRQLNEDGWLETSAQRPMIQVVGERLTLIAANQECNDPARVGVKLNFGLAFGTGDHPTTALCLE